MKIFLLFLAALLAAGAQAQPGDKFRSLDRNGDGFLSRDEVGAIGGYDAPFSEADDDRDGRLSADEFIKAEAIHDRQQVGNYVSDSVLTARVKAALLRERGIKSTDVHVESNQGRVLLSGFVDSEEQKQRALRVASRIGGVREVRDGLNVR